MLKGGEIPPMARPDGIFVKYVGFMGTRHGRGPRIGRWARQLALTALVGVVVVLAAPPSRATTEPTAHLAPEEPTGSAGVVTPSLLDDAQSELSTAKAPSEDAPGAKRSGSKRSKHAARPGGVNPCMTPDPGWGIYDQWSRNVSMGQLLAPQKGGLTKSGGFDLIVHFHGHYPIRKEFVKSARGIVLVAIDLGVGSGSYSAAFSSPQTFERLLDSVEQEMARRSGRKKTHVRKLALSSWSAGYGAVARILDQPAGKKVDAVVLLDSAHAGYADAKAKTLETAQVEPFLEFARRAARGNKFMFQSHSSIIPPGYASTREVSHYMVGKLGGKLRSSKRSDVLGLKMFERFDRRGYHVRGYRGDDKPDHCAHLGLMKDVVKVHLNPRWRTPRGSKGAAQVAKAKTTAKKAGNVHVVVKGDHLGGIARRYGTTVNAIRDANGLTKGGKPIRPGQELIIPESAKASPKSPPKEVEAKPRPGERIHVVGDGQSLGRIAKRYHVSVDAIRERNGLTKGGKRIQPGQKIIIPKK